VTLSPPPSGAEDKHGYIWDRHYNICLARLAHQDVVNCVAFSPADQELLLSASDDATIKVWRSPRMTRMTQSPAHRHRRPRPGGLLSSMLQRSKNPTSTTSSSASSSTTTPGAGAGKGAGQGEAAPGPDLSSKT